MSSIVNIQANSAGYLGKPCTVLSVYDPETGLIQVNKLVTFRQERIKDCLVVGFDAQGDVDAVMTPDHFGDALMAFVRAYKTNKGQGSLLEFAPGTERASPASVIEVGDYEESGPKLRIDSGMTCEHMGVVATCWVAASQIAVRDCFSMFDQLQALQGGMGFSI